MAGQSGSCWELSHVKVRLIDLGRRPHDSTRGYSMTELTKTIKSPKKPYRSPVLTVYGSVKELTGNLSIGPNADTTNMMVTASDRTLKENVVRVGEHPAGF